jgi:type VI protein secretion system component VasF
MFLVIFASMIEKDMTSRELFSRAAGILKAGIPPKEQNQLMHDTLVLCCHEGTRNSGHAFGNLFSQVDYLCNKLHLHLPDKIAVQTMRRHSQFQQTAVKRGVAGRHACSLSFYLCNLLL